MPAAQPPALSLAVIERALSQPRLDGFALPGDRDEVDRVARYLWNMALAATLQEIRELRNRVAHHDPIWNRDVPRTHGRMLEMLGWMSRRVVAAAQTCDRFPAVHARGWAPHRRRAETLMR